MGAVLPLSFAAVLGAAIGSFLNVVAWRLPRKESLVAPASRCPSCASPIKPWHNVPVVGWLALRGRCASCSARISPRYPVVEAATALLVAAVVLRFGADADALPGIALVLLLVPITLIDLDHRIIPNRLTLLGALVALPLVALADGTGALQAHAVAGACAFAFFFAAALVQPKGMGMGDVKLAGVLGLFLGRAVGPGLLIALLAGSLVGLAVIARKGVTDGRRTKVPFGPSMAFGGVVALFAGDPIVEWYLDSFAS